MEQSLFSNERINSTVSVYEKQRSVSMMLNNRPESIASVDMQLSNMDYHVSRE